MYRCWWLIGLSTFVVGIHSAAIAAGEGARTVWHVDLIGGGRVVGVPSQSVVEMETEFGKLAAPVDQVRRMTPGLVSRPDWQRRVEGLVKQLGAAEFAAREAASRELATIRAQAQSALEAARDDADAERRVRARRLLDANLAAKPGEPAEAPWPRLDMLIAGAQTLAGKLRPDPLVLETAYGRVTVPLSMVASLGPPASSRPVNLLREMDLDRDAVVGRWRWDGATLVSPKQNRARLQILYPPPDEYSLHVTMIPKSGRTLGDKPIADSFFVGIVVGGRTCNVALNAFADVKGGPFAGLDTLGRKRTHLAPLFTGAVLKLDEESTAEIAVHRSSVAVSLGGKPLFSWQGDVSELDTSEQWQLREPRRLGLGAHQTEYHIRRFELTPIVEPCPPRELPASHSAVRTKDGSLWIVRIPPGHTAGQSLRLETRFGSISIPSSEFRIESPQASGSIGGSAR